MSERIRPFSCGTQYGDWLASNCERCVKDAHLGPDDHPTCAICVELLNAYLDDGTISAEIAERMTVPARRYVWPCGEWEPTEEWKAEFERRKGEETQR